MRDTDDRRFGDRGMRDREIFDVDGADPLAARFDDVLGAVGDLNEAVFIERRHVAGRRPIPQTRACFKHDTLNFFDCRGSFMPSHTVGTPLVNVTRSFSKRSYKLAPSSCAPGSTSFAPTRHAA